MDDGTDETNDLARAFRRLLEEDGFAELVVAAPDDALADYDLSDEERAAVTADASALEGDVAGFAQRLGFDQIMSIGGLRAPRLISGGLDRFAGSPSALTDTKPLTDT